MAIERRAVTRDNFREALRSKVTPGQEAYVASNAYSLAEAAYEPGMAPFLAYAGQTPVGFALLDHGAVELFTSYVPENAGAAALYAALGCVPTGEVEDGETVVQFPLRSDSR